MTYYEILGVKRNASSAEIKDAYKKLIKKYHPDLYNGDKEFAEKKAKEINVAYDVLSSEEKRKEYDAEVFPKPQTYSYTPPRYETPPSGSNYSEYYRQKYNSERQREYNYYDYAYRIRKERQNSQSTNSNYYSNKFNQTVNKYEERATSAFINFIKKNKIIGSILILTMYLTIIYFSFTRAKAIFTGLNDGDVILPGGTTSVPVNNTVVVEDPADMLYVNGVFNINMIYSDAELRAIYEQRFKNLFSTFEEFKKAFAEEVEREYSFPRKR